MSTASLSLRQWLDVYCSERDLAKCTAKFYSYAVNRFETWAGEPLTLDSACIRINDYLSRRSDDDGSRYTTKTRRGALGVLLREAERRNLCELPRRLRAVKCPELDPSGFSIAEIEALIDASCDLMRAIILLDYCTAVRHKDLFLLNRRHFDPDTRIVRRVMSKSGKKHSVTVAEDALAACEAIRIDGDHRFIPIPYSRETFYDRWHKLGRKAAVNTKDRCLQAIRRTVSSLVAREHGVAAAAALLGHAASTGLTVFLRYYAVGQILSEAPPSPPPLPKGPDKAA